MAQNVEGFKIVFEGVEEILHSYDEINERHKQELKNLRAIEDTSSNTYKNQIKLVAQLKNEKDRLNKTIKEEQKNQKIISDNVGAYQKLSLQLIKTRKRVKDLAASGDTASDEFHELNAEVQQLDEQLKNIDASVGQYQRNVGNYGNRWQALGESISEIDGAGGQAVKGLKGVNRAFKALLANPIVAMIAALVAVVSTLFTAFKRSEKGAKLMATATGVVNVVMSQLTKLANNLSERLTNLFNDPVKSVKNFGKSLKNNVVGLFKDPKGTVKKFKEGIKETTDEIKKQADAFIKLEQAKIANVKAQNALTRSLESFITKEEVANQIAGDTTLSFKEREEAAEKSRKALEQRAKLQIQLAKQNLGLINQEIALRKENGEDVTGLLSQQTSAISEVMAAERELTLSIAENEKERRELKQDRLERDLDFSLDATQKQIDLNMKQIENESLSLQERFKIEAETRKLLEKSFADQTQIIQEFTGKRVNFNDLVKESDGKVIAERVRELELSEVIEGRVLEIINERKQNIFDLGEAYKQMNEIQDEALKVNLDEILVDDEKLFEEQVNALEAQYDKEVELELEKQEELNQIRDEALEKEKERQSQRFELAKNVTDNLQTLSDALLEIELKNAGDNEEKQKEARKRAAVRNKTIAISNVAINTAEAVTKALAQTGTLAPFVVPSIIATGAIQAGVIASTPIQFQDGGLLEGASHANGGIPFTINGRSGFEAEGGEAIINKHSTALFKPLLSEINSYKGFGKKFEKGGLLDTEATISNNSISDVSMIISKIDNWQNTLTVIAKSDDIVNAGLEQRNKKRVLAIG